MTAIVGLGNPGRRYRGTRHNLGYEVVDRLAARLAIRFEDDGWNRVGRGRADGVHVLLAKPETYMNVSGQAVKDLLRTRRRRPADLLVVHDDLDLAIGRLRLRPGGGPGGHNGIRSIIEYLGTADFPRLRVGIGRPPAGVDPAEFVLERFSSQERAVVDAVIDQAADAAFCVAVQGLDAAMNRYNLRSHQGEDGPGP